MMKSAMLAVSLTLTLACAAAEPRRETTLHLTVPKEVAAEAAARAAGDASTSAPVLMLEGLEARAGERLTIEVLGPPDRTSKTRVVLGVAGLVGSGKADPAAPMETMTLVVPLNDTASRLLAKRSEITLTLRLRRSRNRPPLKVKRAYFAPSSP